MFPQDHDRRLLRWIAERLTADVPDQEAEDIERLLGAAPGTPFTEAEIDRILSKARGDLPLDGESRPPEENGPGDGPLPFPRRRRVPSWAALAGLAAAACLLLALGWLFWSINFSTTQDDPNAGPPLAQKPLPPGLNGDLVPRPFFGGKLQPPGKTFSLAHGLGTLRLNSPAQVAVVDADEGQVQLDLGSVYLELRPQPGIEVEVETPLGKVIAGDARCYLGLLEGGPDSEDHLLAVLVLDGQVQFHNSHGFEIAEAGELLLVRPRQDPDKTAPALLSAEDYEWFESQEKLQLLQDAEIQNHLNLDEPSQKKLNQPLPDEAERAEALFESLPGLAANERRQKVSEFFRQQTEQTLALLDANQQQKLQQLHLQHVGFPALVRPEVSEKLNLTPQQQEHIRGHLSKYSKNKQKMFVLDCTNSLELNKNLAGLQQQHSNTIFMILTPNQNQQWKKMAGTSPSPGGSRFSFVFKGVGFHLAPLASKLEEQLWDSWLHKTAQRARMNPEQLNQARHLLQQAKKEAAAYRKSKQQEFEDLTSEFLQLLKSKKLDKQSRQAIEDRIEALHLPAAEIGRQWKEDVLELLTPAQRKSLEQASRKSSSASFSSVRFGRKPAGMGKSFR